MATRTTKGFSWHEQDQKNLDTITKTTGLNGSEVVSYLLAKASQDPLEMVILMQNFIKNEGKTITKKRMEGLLRIMSDMRRKIKAVPTQRSTAATISSNSQFNLAYWTNFVLEKYYMYGEASGYAKATKEMEDRGLKFNEITKAVACAKQRWRNNQGELPL